MEIVEPLHELRVPVDAIDGGDIDTVNVPFRSPCRTGGAEQLQGNKLMISSGGTLGAAAGSRTTAARGGACHSRTVVSAPAEARVLPSGENARELTGPSWPVRVATS